MSKKINHIGDLKPDPQNPRKHTERNIGMIVKSLQELGAGRSILIDENGEVIAGNGVLDAAAMAGIEKVRVVEANGHEIIAVQRKDLKGDAKRRMALLDNRTAELAEWDIDVLAGMEKDLLKEIWSDKELEILFEEGSDPGEGGGDGSGESDPDIVTCPQCGNEFVPEKDTGSYSKTYNTWRGMLSRCYYEKDKAYQYYGAKGVKVCDRWREDFQNFLEDMGERPDGLSIDRKDPSGDYTSENCRWATKIEQRANRRTD